MSLDGERGRCRCPRRCLAERARSYRRPKVWAVAERLGIPYIALGASTRLVDNLSKYFAISMTFRAQGRAAGRLLHREAEGPVDARTVSSRSNIASIMESATRHSVTVWRDGGGDVDVRALDPADLWCDRSPDTCNRVQCHRRPKRLRFHDTHLLHPTRTRLPTTRTTTRGGRRRHHDDVRRCDPRCRLQRQRPVPGTVLLAGPGLPGPGRYDRTFDRAVASSIRGDKTRSCGRDGRRRSRSQRCSRTAGPKGSRRNFIDGSRGPDDSARGSCRASTSRRGPLRSLKHPRPIPTLLRRTLAHQSQQVPLDPAGTSRFPPTSKPVMRTKALGLFACLIGALGACTDEDPETSHSTGRVVHRHLRDLYRQSMRVGRAGRRNRDLGEGGDRDRLRSSRGSGVFPLRYRAQEAGERSPMVGHLGPEATRWMLRHQVRERRDRRPTEQRLEPLPLTFATGFHR